MCLTNRKRTSVKEPGNTILSAPPAVPTNDNKSVGADNGEEPNHADVLASTTGAAAETVGDEEEQGDDAAAAADTVNHFPEGVDGSGDAGGGELRSDDEDCEMVSGDDGSPNRTLRINFFPSAIFPRLRPFLTK